MPSTPWRAAGAARGSSAHGVARLPPYGRTRGDERSAAVWPATASGACCLT